MGTTCCIPPGPDFIPETEAKLNLSTLQKIVNASISLEQKVQKIKETTPELQTFEVLEYRFCVMHAKGLIDAPTYNELVKKVLPIVLPVPPVVVSPPAREEKDKSKPTKPEPPVSVVSPVVLPEEKDKSKLTEPEPPISVVLPDDVDNESKPTEPEQPVSVVSPGVRPEDKDESEPTEPERPVSVVSPVVLPEEKDKSEPTKPVQTVVAPPVSPPKTHKKNEPKKPKPPVVVSPPVREEKDEGEPTKPEPPIPPIVVLPVPSGSSNEDTRLAIKYFNKGASFFNEKKHTEAFNFFYKAIDIDKGSSAENNFPQVFFLIALSSYAHNNCINMGMKRSIQFYLKIFNNGKYRFYAERLLKKKSCR